MNFGKNMTSAPFPFRCLLQANLEQFLKFDEPQRGKSGQADAFLFSRTDHSAAKSNDFAAVVKPRSRYHNSTVSPLTFWK